MKTIASLALFCATGSIAAAASDFTAWRWEQAAEVASPGMVRLDLPPATLDASQALLADPRIISPDGVETPWLLEKAAPARVADVATTGFKATLEGRTTVLTTRQNTGAIEALTLESPASGFLKSVRIEGSNDGMVWQVLANGEVIFRQPGGASRLRIPIAPSSPDQLRVTIDDARSQPVPFTGLRVTPTAAKVETEPLKTEILERKETKGETQWKLGLGAGNLYLADLSPDVPGGVFSRSCRIETGFTKPDGRPARQTIGTGTIYRVIGEDGNAAADLTIPLHQRIATDHVFLVISNGDSPPLEIHSITATRHPDRLLFFARQPGTWKLLTGNRLAAPPDYDLTSIRGELTRTPGIRITPGPLTAKADYKAPATLPEIETAGSRIDLSEWGCRRAVQAVLPGIVKIELDAVALAHLRRDDLGDLRLIQNEKQIPWLMEPSPPLHQLKPAIEEAPDPQRPKVSRWKLTLPVAGLPLDSLTAGSPAPLFSRHLRVIQQGRDELGNPWTRDVGSASWTKDPGGNRENLLHIGLGGTRVPDTVLLETDNGDNPPIRIENVILHFRAPSLVAKFSEPAPVFLYYDNPHATPPVYDLGLVRAELLSADHQTAILGEEEPLQPDQRHDALDISAGSPWLWASLALVVIALLVIVAKMLPKETAGSPP